MAFTDSHLRWVWTTDSHLIATADTRDIALRKAVVDCNDWRPNAFIHTGDIGDNNLERVQRGFNCLKNLRCPWHVSIGNHDEDEQATPGFPNTALLQGRDTFNRYPFYYTDTMTSGDGTLTARLLFPDCQFYQVSAGAPEIVNPYHVVGDRVGYSSGEPSGGSFRQIGTVQRAWMASVLAADTTSQIVLVFPHYPITTPGVFPLDYLAVADILQADGRPAALFAGHVHPDAKTYTLTSTDTLKSYTVYKAPAMQESGAWVRVELHLSAGAIVIDGLAVNNFTQPGAWVINAPFT